MPQISFLSNVMTTPFTMLGQYLERYHFQFEIRHYDIDQIPQVLSSALSDDYLIIILDNTFFFDAFINEKTFEKVRFLETLLRNFRKLNKSKVILSNVYYAFPDFNSSLNMEQYSKLIELNKEIDNISQNISGVSILNLFNMGARIGFENFVKMKNKFLFQAPFSKYAIEHICKEISKHIYLYEKHRKKVCIVDADNTLWGGIVGEDGVDNIQMDQNYPGIIYRHFQNQLKVLKETGILLCLVTKNNVEDLEGAFSRRKMPLKLADFLIRKVNWFPKSENVAEIARELNLGLESFVFIDDSDFELAEVRENLDVVECCKFDTQNLVSNLQLLENIFGLNALKITKEDTAKTSQYIAEKKRTDVSRRFTSAEEFIKSLSIEIYYSINNDSHIARISQLTNKTNQFNLTTRRYSESDIEKVMKEHLVFDFKVIDKFGDMGIVGVVIIKENVIDTFLLSCRVLGRKIEEKIIKIVQDEVSKMDLRGIYLKTAKNGQVEDLYDKLGFQIAHSDEKRKEYVLDQTVRDIPHIMAVKVRRQAQ